MEGVLKSRPKPLLPGHNPDFKNQIGSCPTQTVMTAHDPPPPFPLFGKEGSGEIWVGEVTCFHEPRPEFTPVINPSRELWENVREHCNYDIERFRGVG